MNHQAAKATQTKGYLHTHTHTQMDVFVFLAFGILINNLTKT